MQAHFRLDYPKTLETLLYISSKCHDMYTLLKVLFFADKDHLSKYGRLITGESYIAMKHGPVPSAMYDMIKDVRDNRSFGLDDTLEKSFKVVNQTNVFPLRRPNLSYLSASDIECLDLALNKYSNLSFRDLHTQSVDTAWEKANENDAMDLRDIIETLPNSIELMEEIFG